MPPPPTLVVLAAGRSTRFGRPKQLEPITADGRTLIDLTLADAFAAGCGSAVLVASPWVKEAFREKYGADGRVRLPVQSEALGTAHAALIGLDGLNGTAVLVNGDDHYGSGAIGSAVGHALHGNAAEHALVAYQLANTLSPSGGVNRAVCAIDGAGKLLSTEEVTGLRAEGILVRDAAGHTWPGNTPVSMNLWVLRPSIRPLITELAAVARQGEYGLPEVARQAIGQGQVFRTIITKAEWTGLTHAADAEQVRQRLKGA
jgi:hypothetical protein